MEKTKKSSLSGKVGALESIKNTGSPESQITLFTRRIEGLTERLRTHKKDKSSRLGLVKLVSRRRRMLAYLKRSSLARFRNIVSSLGLRA